MAIQVRRGLSSGLVKTKLLPGEVAITTDTGELYYCASAGNVKLAATIEDVKHLLNISEESFIALQELIDTLNSDESLSTSMLSDISELKQQMQSVETTVNDTSIIFIEADEDSELTSGLSVKILFGLIKKKFNTILTKLVGKVDTSKIANNLATTEAGFVLDARQGKNIQDQLTSQNNNLANKKMFVDGGLINPGTDFDTLQVTGIYRYGVVSNYTNAPTGDYGILEVLEVNKTYILQRATNVNSRTVKQRSSANGGVSWLAWV